MKEYCFDVYLRTVARVKSESEKEAFEYLDTHGDEIPFDSGLITEMSLVPREELNHQPSLFLVIHEDGTSEDRD